MYLLELMGDEADDAFARREAASRCSGVEALSPGLATARGARRSETLAYTRRVCRLVGTCAPDVDSAVALLEAASVEGSGGIGGSADTVAVRARDVRGLAGVDTQAAERRLGRVLVDRGFEVDLDDPDRALVALFSETAALGWLEVETPRDFSARQPSDRPFFQPGSMDPMEARALANVVGADVGVRVLDPMCGTGGILVEAGLVGADVVGLDAQEKMARGARRNLERYLDGDVDGAGAPRTESTGGFETVRGDATRLPFADGAFDGAVFDAPYGRQSKIAGRSLESLVGEALSEARRVANRAALVGDRAWDGSAEAAGWTVESRFERRVHRSLTRFVHVLE